MPYQGERERVSFLFGGASFDFRKKLETTGSAFFRRTYVVRFIAGRIRRSPARFLRLFSLALISTSGLLVSIASRSPRHRAPFGRLPRRYLCSTGRVIRQSRSSATQSIRILPMPRSFSSRPLFPAVRFLFHVTLSRAAISPVLILETPSSPRRYRLLSRSSRILSAAGSCTCAATCSTCRRHCFSASDDRPR